jgi:hypothetical protein
MLPRKNGTEKSTCGAQTERLPCKATFAEEIALVQNNGSALPKKDRLADRALLGLGVWCNQSAVTMRRCTGFAAGKFALPPRSGTAGGTADSEYLFGAEFLFHTRDIA